MLQDSIPIWEKEDSELLRHGDQHTRESAVVVAFILGFGRFRVVSMLLLLPLAINAFAMKALAQDWQAGGRISYSPDGQAWTIREKLPNASDAGNKRNPSCWYPLGETVITGEVQEPKDAVTGQHFYDYERKGSVSVWKWEVAHPAGKCIHNDSGVFHGMTFTGDRCLSSYYSGWRAFCADCGRQINEAYVYMSKEAAAMLHDINLDLDYFYHCPTCGHLEQGRSICHKCKAISSNRYRVVYRMNANNVAGTMQASFHMYDNASFFEGQEVSLPERLNLNTYSRTGYIFEGWNSEPDGSGRQFADGQKILNLTAENYEEDTGKGTVVLYAQWRRSIGKLEIDPGRGMYDGNADKTVITVKYGETIILDSAKVTPPGGYVIRFDTMGGERLDPVMCRTEFAGWKSQSCLHGELQENCYTFFGEDGTSDQVTVLYQNKQVTLPRPVRSGYSFAGWYEDRSLTRPAGVAGESYLPKADMTLYACWAELVLTAKPDATGNQGKGAVDLFWQQPDGRNKHYLIYQKNEGGNFGVVGEELRDVNAIPAEEFPFCGRSEIYRIRENGFYELQAQGAQGQDYGDFHGGRGATVRGTFFLEKGDEIVISVGSENGYGGGGKATLYGGGGGCTTITSSKNGVLMIAGGGGGASPAGDGGKGGLEDGLISGDAELHRSDMTAGQSGPCGGGAGAIGGLAGTRWAHTHTSECFHIHRGDEQNGGECYRLVRERKNCHVTVAGPFCDWVRSNDCTECLAHGRNGHGSMHIRCWRIYHDGCGCEPDLGGNGWWQCDTCGLIGFCWGSGTERPHAEDHLFDKTYYRLDCDRQYDCGKPDEVITVSHGGSSFICEELATDYEYLAGDHGGDGSASVKPKVIGYTESMYRRGVPAPDQAAPKQIAADSVSIEKDGEEGWRISFAKPEDCGTTYVHVVESYLPGHQEALLVSNVTSSCITTGVSGFYYRADDNENTVVTKQNADNKEELLDQPVICLSSGMKENLHAYLHVAPVDGAGNIGKTLNIRLDHARQKLTQKLYTKQVHIAPLLSSDTTGIVEADGEGSYFVKADGRTEFMLFFEGWLEENMQTKTRINDASFIYHVHGRDLSGEFHMVLSPDNTDEISQVSAAELGRRIIGNTLLEAAMTGGIRAWNWGKSVCLEQSFTLAPSLDGWKVEVYPALQAQADEGLLCSEQKSDTEKGITLIGDATAPRIDGLDRLDDCLATGDMGGFAICEDAENEFWLDLTAQDELSGVESFTVTIINTDNDWEKIFLSDENGHIQIRFDKASQLFSGNLLLRISATDRVGNRTYTEYHLDAFGIRADVERRLEPHVPYFKRGESGCLYIKAWGYPGRIEIEYPEFMANHEDCPPAVLVYERPTWEVAEELEFMIPLDTKRDGEYRIIVRAYKQDPGEGERSAACTVWVHDTVLDELRTLLR